MGDKIDPTAIMNTLFVTISVKLLAHSFSAACCGLWVVQPLEPSECCAFSETQVMSRRSQLAVGAFGCTPFKSVPSLL